MIEKHSNVKIKIMTSLANILVVFLVCGVLLCMARPVGGTRLLAVNSGNCGLVVTAEKRDDTGNLNPGDRKNSHILTLQNTNSTPLRYYFNIYRETRENSLDEILEITVTRGDEKLFQGLLSKFNEMDMGILEGFHSQVIDIFVYFPPETGNEYQGASVAVRFEFRSVCDQPAVSAGRKGCQIPAVE